MNLFESAPKPDPAATRRLKDWTSELLAQPEMNQGRLHVLVAGLRERSPSQSGFADLSRADNDNGRELLGQFL